MSSAASCSSNQRHRLMKCSTMDSNDDHKVVKPCWRIQLIDSTGNLALTVQECDCKSLPLIGLMNVRLPKLLFMNMAGSEFICDKHEIIINTWWDSRIATSLGVTGKVEFVHRSAVLVNVLKLWDGCVWINLIWGWMFASHDTCHN